MNEAVYILKIFSAISNCFILPEMNHFQLTILAALLSRKRNTSLKVNSNVKCENVLPTCILSGTPVESIRLATLTVSPHMSYWGFSAPITPAIAGP